MPYPHRRWLEGCHVAIHFQEIKAQGYPSGRGMVRRYVKNLHKCLDGVTVEAQRHFLAANARFETPSVRNEKDLGANRRVFLEKLTRLCPEAQAFRRLGLDVEQMVREGDATALSGWLEAAEASGVHESKGFALRIRQDLAAVTAALHFEWRNGQTAGQPNCPKLLKRQMFGRANFDPLRVWVLHSTWTVHQKCGRAGFAGSRHLRQIP